MVKAIWAVIGLFLTCLHIAMLSPVQRETLDFPDFCKTLGIGETKGRDLVRRGLVPHIRAGRRIVIPRRVVNEILSGERDLNAPYNEHANDR